MAVAGSTVPSLVRRPRPAPPRLYAIADLDLLGVERFDDAVRTMADAGVRWIQVRAKRGAGGELYDTIERCRRSLATTGTELWINDRADLAALLEPAGLHLGQTDLPPGAARRVCGVRPWIGSSTHDEAQVRRAEADPDVDVIAVGPVFATTSKEAAGPARGLDFVRRARALVTKPLIAIGGITADNAGAVLGAGADAVAVLSAVGRGDVAANCRRLLAATRN